MVELPLTGTIPKGRVGSQQKNGASAQKSAEIIERLEQLRSTVGASKADFARKLGVKPRKYEYLTTYANAKLDAALIAGATLRHRADSQPCDVDPRRTAYADF